MNEALSDTDNPSHLHLDLESNIFFLRKTRFPITACRMRGPIGVPSRPGVHVGTAGGCGPAPGNPQRTEEDQQSRRHDAPVPRVTI